MALAYQSNIGFVPNAPTGDPGGTGTTVDTRAYTIRDTAPVGATVITEIGWWCDNATEAANFEVGLYPDDGTGIGSKPHTTAAAIARYQTNAKGTTAGWKSVTGLNIAITSGVIYHIAIQVDDTATTTNIDYADIGSGVTIATRKTSQTTLTDPWGTSSGLINAHAIYAVYSTGATPVPVIMNQYRQRRN